MIELRIVRDFDGGNHFQREVIQFREQPGAKWSDVQVMSSREALIADLADGTTNFDEHPQISPPGRRDLLEAVELLRSVK